MRPTDFCFPTFTNEYPYTPAPGSIFLGYSQLTCRLVEVIKSAPNGLRPLGPRNRAFTMPKSLQRIAHVFVEIIRPITKRAFELRRLTSDISVASLTTLHALPRFNTDACLGEGRQDRFSSNAVKRSKFPRSEMPSLDK